MAFGDFMEENIYMILFTMWFGGLIPTYLVMSKLNLVGSLGNFYF